MRTHHTQTPHTHTQDANHSHPALPAENKFKSKGVVIEYRGRLVESMALFVQFKARMVECGFSDGI